jgi:multimeric flavodoxin WrbA
VLKGLRSAAETLLRAGKERRVLKVLGLSCSPRKAGNTEVLVMAALEGARTEGAEVELFGLAGKEINPCDGCNACHRTGRCRVEDDMQSVYEKMAEADGIIFGTPVYFYGMTAQMKAVIDRTYAPLGPGKSLANKVGGIIAVAGSVGLIDVVKDLYFYFAVKRMLPGNWVGAYATAKGDIGEKAGAMKAAHELGRELVQLASGQFQFPPGFARSYFAYGTHTH